MAKKPRQPRYSLGTIREMSRQANEATDGDVTVSFNPLDFSNLLYVLYRVYKYGDPNNKTTQWAEYALDDIAESLGYPVANRTETE